MMKLRTFLRMSVAVMICVSLWLFTSFEYFDVEGMDAGAVSEYKISRRSAKSGYVDAKMRMKMKEIEKELKPGLDMDKVTGLTFKDRVFYLNGLPLRIFSGAVHYFRIVPEHWADRLKKLKACGLNTVETYVAWNLHEPSPGVYNFEGMLDLRKFIMLAAEIGLYVIFRPGPFICAEFEFGGLPGWLLKDPAMQVRTNYPGYMSAVSRYFDMLLPKVVDLQFTKGGPIIMFQVENEYSSFGTSIDHLELLLYMMKSHGLKELFVTSDHKTSTQLDFSKYALPTDNFGDIIGNSFSLIRQLNPHFPLMVMEWWTGWFDYWGLPFHHAKHLKDVNKTMNFIMDQGASFNLYMFVGGTNFGFNSGANNLSGYLQPMVTSYDYDAILTEAGDITPKYHIIRDKLLDFYKSIGITSLPPVPPNSPKGDYGTIEVTEMMEWDIFLSLVPISATDSKVNFMESYLDHNNNYHTRGYIVYSYYIRDATHWNRLRGVQLTDVRDRLLAILNGEIFYMMDSLGNSDADNTFHEYTWHQNWQEMATKLKKQTGKKSRRLDLVVENLGRINYSPQNVDLFQYQRKGLQGPVFHYIFGVMDEWKIRFIDFSPEQCEILSKSSTWSPVKDVEREREKKQEGNKEAPTLYRAYLHVMETPIDTFVKMEGWRKGVVIVNGFNLGRYWHIGPQKTLYLPGPVLRKGLNEILVFEELWSGKSIRFQATAQLGG